ncbi:MAG: MBL fold metallo-hydrolase [Planctomycetota bacterium]|jgi:7,8-dihydropterin-6-yl-methyl-4-(beta-D-ribofuranosyl)aminobenzene 5'-phosphate synthase
MNIHTTDTDVSVTRREVVLAGVTAPIWLPGLARSAMAEPVAPDHREPQKQDFVMTIVYDNYPGREGLISEWGFACAIHGPEGIVLFDTGGSGRILLANMRQLNVNIKKIDAVVLSHNHWDHVGGLPSLAAERPDLPVYMPTGFPAALAEHARSIGARPIEAAESKEIRRGVRTTGTLRQGVIEEHGLCVKTSEGWVLVTGCAHPGVDNMVAQAKKVTGGAIHLAFGGFHMGRHSKSNADAVIDRLEELGVARVAPCHCTGDEARGLFKKRYDDRCELPAVGSVFRKKVSG